MNSLETKIRHTAYMKSYRADHPEYVAKALARGKVYTAMHRENIKVRHKAYCISHQEESRAKSAAHGKIYRATHKEHLRWLDKKLRYGLSRADFDTLLEKQGGACAVCKKADWNGRGPMVDHNHETGKVRGLLCVKCNVSVGMVNDDPKIAQALTDYLRTWTEE